ncbi:lasso peptide biosynthesis B2 protein [Streptomyces sparsogenes]|uniref:lasso peptide biosynthesis B2 protein n=1 Tax=Streptomyces sparsogenes TaxID=67365 RepID=UPI0033CC72A5
MLVTELWLARLPDGARHLVAARPFWAVRRAGRSWPGHVACLEESLGCFFAAYMHGRRLTWVIGVRTAPAAAHAWVQAHGEVIGQDPAERVWPYAPALRI